jgi:hypothetical protein
MSEEKVKGNWRGDAKLRSRAKSTKKKTKKKK